MLPATNNIFIYENKSKGFYMLYDNGICVVTCHFDTLEDAIAAGYRPAQFDLRDMMDRVDFFV
jgi:hypothetical protein